MSGKNDSTLKFNKSSKLLLTVISALIILLLLGIQYFVQVRNNREQAFLTAEMLIGQVVTVMDNNEKKNNTLVASLKEDYVTRAKAVSYILDHNQWIENSNAELNRVSRLINVDEIHVFNEAGEIYSGTVPKYYGFSFDSGEQMAYFKPMLKDKKLTMCQDITPNTAEGKPMMYAICWNDKGTRMVQIGIEPLRLMEELRANEITEVIGDMPSYDGIDIVMADRNTGEVLASSMGIMPDALPEEINAENIGLDRIKHFILQEDRGKVYCAAALYNNYIIAIMQNKDIVDDNIPLSLGITFVYLLIAAVVMNRSIVIMTAHILEEQRNANTDAMTGLYNRRAYENALKKYKKTPPGEHFIYVSMDLNGLKRINDSGGHEEGDRLIRIAACCMKRCFGNYGRIFRIGGDEFAALIYDDDSHIEKVKADFDRTLEEESAKNNISVSVSCGLARAGEFPGKSIEELAKALLSLARHFIDGKRSLVECVDLLMKKLEEAGPDALYEGSYVASGLTMPRRQEIFACLNRCRFLRIKQ